jgi:putative endonuclease
MYVVTCTQIMWTCVDMARFARGDSCQKNERIIVYDTNNMGSLYHVYLLECADGSFYVGMSSNVDRRVSIHNNPHPKSKAYTAHRTPVTLIRSWLVCCKHCTHKSELKLKHMSRDKKILVSQFPDLFVTHECEHRTQLISD